MQWREGMGCTFWGRCQIKFWRIRKLSVCLLWADLKSKYSHACQLKISQILKKQNITKQKKNTQQDLVICATWMRRQPNNRQWLSTSLTLQLFNTVAQVVVTPDHNILVSSWAVSTVWIIMYISDMQGIWYVTLKESGPKLKTNGLRQLHTTDRERFDKVRNEMGKKLKTNSMF